MNPRNFRIGILGGGQLAKMTAISARKLGFEVLTLDPSPEPPASQVAKHIRGDFRNPHDIRKFSDMCDVMVLDIENVSVEDFYASEEHIAKKLIPSPEVVIKIKDKFLQKKIVSENGVPTPRFDTFPPSKEKFDFPVVQKLRIGGYDGRGVKIVNSEKEFILDRHTYLEEFVNIKKELAVIVAIDRRGNYVVYPVVEMVFDRKANILDYLVVPARIPKDVEESAKKVALKSAQSFSSPGIFAVEMFWIGNNTVLFNEIAPRPHNSGHYTIEACYTSQFEQIVRIAVGLPLGSPELISPCVMINLLGEGEGEPYYEGLEEVLAIPGVSVHIYGKSKVFPFRKMGHITILDKDVESAIEKARFVKSKVKVKGK
jgi:5-(carboxyamino)imidazole ribonucleotide synthase